MIGPAEIDDILSDYADALEAAGTAPSVEALVWPLCATTRSGTAPRAGGSHDPRPAIAGTADAKSASSAS